LSGKTVDAGSKIQRHDGVIDWSEEAYKNPKHEPEKWEMAARFQKENPDVWFVGVFDNATAHINGYENIFGHNIVSVHIKGDLPPNSPSLIDGVFTIDPWQLEREIAEIGGVPRPDLSRPPAPLAGPAFAPMLEAIKAAWKSGKRPVVAVDIDDTIFESSERVKGIMSEFYSSWQPGNTWVKEFVSKFTPFNVEYGAQYVTQQAGLSHLGFDAEFQNAFMERFLGKEEAHKVGVRKNALNWILALESLGVRIIYLGGRQDSSEVRKATAWQLKSLGFPVDDMGVELVMRKNQGESNEVFKAEAMEGLVGPFDYVVGVFDKDTKVLSELSRMYGRAPLYRVGDSAAPDSPEAPDGTIPIPDFSGKIGPFSKKKSVKLGEEMRLEGNQLATEFVKRMLGFWAVEKSFTKADGKVVAAPLLSDAVSILKKVASLDPAHPLHAAFVQAINREYEDVPDRLVRPPEDFLDVVNRNSKDPFVILRGPEGVTMIGQAKKGVLKISSSYMPRELLYSPPSPLDVMKDPGGVNLFSALTYINQGPDFFSLKDHERVRALLGLERFFPRADFALSHAVGSVMERTGKGLSDIRVVGHSPGTSLYTLVSLANMGINVEWFENDAARRLQTEYAIGSLPKELRARIRHVDINGKRKPADLIILTGDDVGPKLKYIVGKEFGDTVIVQSEVTASQFEDELKGKSKFECKGSLQCGKKGFVLPVSPYAKSAASPTFMILQKAK